MSPTMSEPILPKPEVRRVYRQFTTEERERWLRARAEVEAEKPEILARYKVLCEAAAEPTVSGAVRRAVHRAGPMLPQIAKEAGLTETHLHEFLLGERTLRSDVLDRLARIVGFDLPEPARPVSVAKERATVVAAIPPLDVGPAATSSTAST
jgi:hypothetical protein